MEAMGFKLFLLGGAYQQSRQGWGLYCLLILSPHLSWPLVSKILLFPAPTLSLQGHSELGGATASLALTGLYSQARQDGPQCKPDLPCKQLSSWPPSWQGSPSNSPAGHPQLSGALSKEKRGVKAE